MKPYAPYLSKAQSNRDQWLQSSVRVIDGRGRFGGKARPFNPEAAVGSFRSWVYPAVKINSTAVSSLPLRLFVRNDPSRTKAFRTRPVAMAHKRYLMGDASGPQGNVLPHKHTMRKIIEFGSDFEEVVDSHPILELMRKVNPWFNGFDLIELATMYLELLGNAYIHPVINELGVPGELWPMPSQWVFVVPDRDKFIKGYVYGSSSEQQLEFEADEVMHIRTTNPGKDGLYYGMGKPQAAWGAIQLNESNHDMDLSMAENHARPDYLMVAGNATTSETLDRFESQVNSMLRGSRKSGKFLTISGDVDLKPLNFPPKDLAGREEVIEEIAAVFGVPVSMLLPNDPNLASSKTGYAQWRETTILPLAKLIEQKLNEFLLPMFGIDNDAVLAFDNPVPADEQFELDTQTRLTSGGIMTANESRSARGLDESNDPMADRLLINGQPLGVQINPLSGFGLSAPATPSRPVAPQEAANINIENRSVGLQDSDIDKIAMKVLKGLQNEKDDSVSRGDIINNSIDSGNTDETYCDDHTPSDDSADLLVGKAVEHKESSDDCTGNNLAEIECSCSNKITHHSDLIYKVAADQDIREDQPDTPESRLRIAVQGVFDQVSNDLDEMVGKTLGGKIRQKITSREIQRVLDRISRMGTDLEQAIFEPLSDMLQASFLQGLKDIDVTGFDITSTGVQDFIRSRTTLLSGELTSVTRARVEQVLQDGVGSGATPTELSRGIEETGAFSLQRASAIARTESADAYVQGKKESWRQSGVVQGVKWLLAPNACEFCKALAARFNERALGLDDAFFKLGDTVTGTEGGRLKVNFRDITGPPLHPNDRCDLVAVLKDVNDAT